MLVYAVVVMAVVTTAKGLQIVFVSVWRASPRAKRRIVIPSAFYHVCLDLWWASA